MSWPISGGSAVSWFPSRQLLEAGELADLRRQRGQLVVVEFQRLEAGELADLRRQRGQLVAVEVQRLEVGELADLRGSAPSGLLSSISD